LPYVIENVPGARAELRDPVVLTGEMFGLGVHRPRLFETNWPILVPQKPPPNPKSIGVYGKAHDGRRRKLEWSGRVTASRKHSAKPDGFFDLVTTCSPGPYLELFARSQRQGWDTWGDEALNHVDLQAVAR
jgi:hypothetical protein